MTTTLTLARLRDLRLSGMAEALERQQEQSTTYEALPFLERLGLLVEQECLAREQRKQNRLIQQARFKLRATIQDIDYQHPRNLQPAQIARLLKASGCSALKTCSSPGPCGSGKLTWPVPWDTMPACKAIVRAYYRLSRLLLALTQAKRRAVTRNCWHRPQKSGCLLIDDWGLDALTLAQRHDLMEILDDRYGAPSTVMVSQLPVDQWYATIGDNTLADALLDRLIHNAHRLSLKEESMRKKMGMC